MVVMTARIISMAHEKGVDAVEIGPHFLDSPLGDAQDRQPVVAEEQSPGINIRLRVVEHGVKLSSGG